MAEEQNSKIDLAENRTDLAKSRTDWAEDRTVLANERTFAGWMRTGLAAVGIGLGFNALFGKLQPFWLPRAIASLFILIGIFIFYMAQRNGCRVQRRMSAHDAKPMKGMNLQLIAGAMATGSICLAIGMWLIEMPDN
ncbi:MAG: DUF202 domain-containing protein [Parasphingorhabdus sp.]|uniref:YidH family protein n=1 Tax=Parasphingorhabdus sp. TaxID=2709688 RepID=UPI003002E297